jgi:hypothetical protein
MTTIAALRAWSAGSYSDTAVVELLARAFGGRFAGAGHPWIGTDAAGRTWLDGDALRAASGLSGGERRVLALVAALIDLQPVEIVDVVSGLDRHHLDLVLAAHGARRRQPRARDRDSRPRRHVSPGEPRPAAPLADHQHPVSPMER